MDLQEKHGLIEQQVQSTFLSGDRHDFATKQKFKHTAYA